MARSICGRGWARVMSHTDMATVAPLGTASRNRGTPTGFLNACINAAWGSGNAGRGRGWINVVTLSGRSTDMP